jgi:L-ascorbate metabolism protein UlaG (beta-lactamase superfamily)
MEIIWHGQSCFTVKGRNATVVTDPYGDIGLRLPKLKGSIVTISHDHIDHNNVAGVEGDPKVFDWPGEFESGGVLMSAVEAPHYGEGADDEAKKRGKTLMFHFEVDGIKICHVGDLGQKLTDEMIEKLGDVDILMVPVGGNFTIDHKVAHSVIEQIEPRVVIPMHYKIDGLTVDIGELEPFLKEVGMHEPAEDKLVFKNRGALPTDAMKTVVLNRQG